ncbi:uncharacterized protein F5Z01DRAFT_120308 [Emericellopsis atlantica]|uniref:Xylanolytic transcriptional activator regulatory domain-containing protein n=1 Tax=Emericellopsis atlantica TaxID=2614577 RepID=A0A9P8CQY1_9HYPO|nr:uncharacterized protein F5Z01DRAFT_120308 [Emericellopsis atlantica]KAG9254176.1 hypothetical protein F5Z01DRAFT_120308 [Emericellopsis atlantica]
MFVYMFSHAPSFLLSRLQTLSNPSRPRSLQGRGDEFPPQLSRFEYHSPHPFPSHSIAREAIAEYFREFHVAHPILDHSTLLAWLEQQPAMTAKAQSSLTASEKRRLFQLNMAMGIGSVRLYRDGLFKLHPFGFFTAALEIDPPAASCFNDAEGIENVLLIARFGVYYNIGCSLWELGRLCIRTAVELGLHQQRPGKDPSTSEESERHHKIMWETYLLDRLSSLTLGRPFAINDAHIQAPLPTSLPTPQGASMSVFNWLVDMGRLSSRIHLAMDECKAASSLPLRASRSPALDSAADLGQTFCLLRTFHAELRTLRDLAPFVEGTTCLYEAREFFELTYQEERLRLLRAAIEALASSKRLPPNTLLRPCLQAAHAILSSFAALRAKNLVTFSRANTHLIFIASLVIVVVLNIHIHQQAEAQKATAVVSDVDVEEWLRDLDEEPLDPGSHEAWGSLDTAGSLLSWFAESMLDMAVYSHFFHTIRQQLECAIARLANTGPTTAATTSGAEAMDATPSWIPVDLSVSHNAAPQEGGEVTWAQEGNDAFNWDTQLNFAEAYLNAGQYGDMAPGTWPLADMMGMEGIAAGISGFVWDTAIPWQGSPTASMDH